MALHPGSHSSQSTDAINAKPLGGAVQADQHGLKGSGLGSMQEIARQRNDKPNTLGGSGGGENPGASVK